MTDENQTFRSGSAFLDERFAKDPEFKAGFERHKDALEGVHLLQDLFRRSGKRRKDVADALGVAPSRVTQALRGEQRDGPSYGFIKRFARACGFEWSGGSPATITPLVSEMESAVQPDDAGEIGRAASESVDDPGHAQTAADIVAEWQETLEREGSLSRFFEAVVQAQVNESQSPQAAAYRMQTLWHEISHLSRLGQNLSSPKLSLRKGAEEALSSRNTPVQVRKCRHELHGEQSFDVVYGGRAIVGHFVTVRHEDDQTTVPAFMLPLTSQQSARGED
jgi:transcriptional regulator with XRE-family HTH domain